MRRFTKVLLVGSGVLLAGAVMAATPDFTGVWEIYPSPFGPSESYDPIARFDPEPPPPGGDFPLREPYASAYKAKKKQMDADEKAGKAVVTAHLRCVPEGMPSIMAANYNLEFLQTPKVVVVLGEFLGQTRRIFLNDKMPPLDEITPSYQGYSVGHWEGDTLVVETLGVREDVLYEIYMMPHSKNMKITERIRLTKPGYLEDQLTIDDPEVLTRPYRFKYGYRKDPDYKIWEFNCENKRYDVEKDGTVKLDVDPH